MIVANAHNAESDARAHEIGDLERFTQGTDGGPWHLQPWQ